MWAERLRAVRGEGGGGARVGSGAGRVARSAAGAGGAQPSESPPAVAAARDPAPDNSPTPASWLVYPPTYVHSIAAFYIHRTLETDQCGR